MYLKEWETYHRLKREKWLRARRRYIGVPVGQDAIGSSSPPSSFPSLSPGLPPSPRALPLLDLEAIEGEEIQEEDSESSESEVDGKENDEEDDESVFEDMPSLLSSSDDVSE